MAPKLSADAGRYSWRAALGWRATAARRMDQTAGQIRSFIVANFLFGEEPAALADGTSFVESGILDSTGVLELVAFLEETFGLSIEDREMTLANLDSIRGVADFVRRKTGGAGR